MGRLLRLGMSLFVSVLLAGSTAAVADDERPSLSTKSPRAVATAKQSAVKKGKKRKKCKKGWVRRHGKCVKRKTAPKPPSTPSPGGGDPSPTEPPRLDRLVLSPATATIAPPQPQGGSADYAALPSSPPASQAYSAQGLDAIGSPLGNVTAQATFALEPDGVCLGSVCSGGTPGAHTVRASAGGAAGTAGLTVAPYADAYSMTCKGENYDLDGGLGNGCEAAQPIPGHTTAADATPLGSFSCDDGSSAQNFGGTVISDQRVHAAPAVPGFTTSGSAPRWHKLTASGGLCTNDLKLVVTTSGGSSASPCYALQVFGAKDPHTLSVSGAGVMGIELGAGSYVDGATISFAFERTCAAAREKVQYTVTGHL